jgi:CarboxypepD_reg-like domain/TonB-dependent Receptor Plug Domain
MYFALDLLDLTKTCAMRNHIVQFVTACIVTLPSLCGFSQVTVIRGNIHETLNGLRSAVASASVVVKGSTVGTFSDSKGDFRLSTSQKPPFTLVVTSIGYESKEIVVADASALLDVELQAGTTLGSEVVVSASRVPERIMQSPVSVERLNVASIQSSPASTYYDAIRNLVGVDFTTSSLIFNTPSTRGFNGSGNVRFNQVVDGMDNQSPGLNFPVAGLIGLTELDVDNMELLEGASSALYGPGGMNGTLVITPKDPFKYPGVSAEVKAGVMNINSPVRSASPYTDVAVRWAQKITNRFAFKLSGEYLQAKDWVAYDSSDYNQATQQFVPGGTRENNPAYNGVNLYGDEYISQIPDMLTLSNEILAGASQQYSAGYYQQTGMYPTQAQINTYLATNPATQPFYVGVTNGIIKNQYVTRTGYREADVMDPNAWNLKISGGLYYKITDDLTASLVGYWGTGNTVYTGSDRYDLKNLKMGQYKFELNSKNWFLRGFTTQENSGDAYNMTVNTELLNEAWKPSVNVNNLAGSWYPQFIGAYVGAISGGATEQQAYNEARSFADQGRPAPGSAEFTHLADSIASIPIPNGGKFLDRSKLYMVEGQYNFTDLLGWKDKGADLLAGANWKQYDLNSQGTLFADTAGPILINEFGAYAQLSKTLFKDVLKITVSARYDKNENFAGRFTPRASAVIEVAKNQFVRLSYQSAYRFPTTQNQWINLSVGGNEILIGGLPQLREFYNFSSNPVYTYSSVQAGTPQMATFGQFKAESVNSFEVGYKALVMNSKLLIDVYGYYAQYQNMLTRETVLQSPDGTLAGLANPIIYSVSVNSPSMVSTDGYGASLQYLLRKNFYIQGNFFFDEINTVPPGLVTYYNTPLYRANIGIGNSGFGFQKRFGFNLIWRWQDSFYEQSDFVAGPVSAFSTLDAQVMYKLLPIKSVIKLGATNLTNHYYVNAPGNPSIGGLYYLSFAFNVL